MKKDTRAWLAKADEDLRVAQSLSESKEVFKDAICFHCQQAAEKYLKGMLCELGMTIPHIHDLTSLAKSLAPHVPGVLLSRERLSALSEFAVDYRYPGITATKPQARSSMRTGILVQQLCHQWLESRTTLRRKHS